MTAVDLGANARIPDFRVNGIGEVNRRGPARQRNQLALWREAEHLVLEEFEARMLEKLLRRVSILQRSYQ